VLSVTTRIILGTLGALIAIAGLVAAGAGAGVSGVWAAIVGAALIIAVVIERNRYRSEAADRTSEPPGPGGGEPRGTIEARFRPTDEAFVDPTTGVKMRVLVDSRTGERRYVADD
jgi:hypothetical protein